jgi:hypothetical protein
MEQAQQERDARFKPEIKNGVGNIADDDAILVGSPYCWSTIAPPVAMFFPADCRPGKMIIPFVTHGGSRLGQGVSGRAKLMSNAARKGGCAFDGSGAKLSEEDVETWLLKMQTIFKTKIWRKSPE